MVATASKKTSVASAATAVKRVPVKASAGVNHKPEAVVKVANRGKTTQINPKKAALSNPVVAEGKVKKPKLVRDSFTMPEEEYAVLGQVKKNCLKAGIEVKKSQLLRIGLALLNKADSASLKKMIAELPPLKAGRPKKEA